MPVMKEYPPGTFCWVDLATTDAAAARQFYTELLSWTATDVPAGAAGTYTMLYRNGRSVCALYAMSEEMRKMGIPPHWLSYVSVASADESTEMVTRLGGTVQQPPFDVMDVGRMSLVQDPVGATFALWQPKTHTGAELLNEPGALCWNELYARDTAAAARFYAGLFGWTTRASKSATGDLYTEFLNGGSPAGGMLQIKEEWGNMPPHWAVYFAVADFDATMKTAGKLGAKPEMEPMEVEGVGRFVFLQDVQGAYFAVIQVVPAAA